MLLSTGMIDTQSKSATTQIAKYKKELTELETRMDKLMTRYMNQFSVMESIVGNSNSLRTSLKFAMLEAVIALARLLRQTGQVVTHRQLLADVWGAEHTGQTHYLRLYMGQLRAKLEADSADPQHLLTEPGVGYRMAEQE